MKDKEKLSMYVAITRITIILCWIALNAFWCLKLFGGNWFEIMVENENFIKFSDMVQNSWLKYLVSLFTVFVANFLAIGAISQKFFAKGKELIIDLILILSIWFVSIFLDFLYMPMWYGMLVLIIYGFVYHKDIKRVFGIVCVGLQMIFSTISMLIRNIELSILSTYLIAWILSIDIYIMFGLYYLYSNLIKLKKENTQWQL